MLANTGYQLIGLLMQVVAGYLLWIKSVEYITERWGKIKETQYKAQIETAKANNLSAYQVAEFLKQLYNTKAELEEMKKSEVAKRSEDQTRTNALVKQIDRMEGMLDRFGEQLTTFIYDKAFPKHP